MKYLFLIALVFTTFVSSISQAQSAPKCQAVFSDSVIGKVTSVEAISETVINNVLIETIEGHGNITSRYSVNQSEALELGERWMGQKYSQIGKAGSGVFVSADGKRRFRIDNNSLLGNLSPHKPHVHLELVNPITQIVISNNHIMLK
ncbi:hypothetical protein [Bdellovibrio sp. KM01]|uniref:hypothetical protein n=1 Tax=Bdellovibrio sp. KM01 TaxID=2748865 RepID=UPI001C676A7B|nr:hypothetical protein [Bdellovibrio sp. KM01]